jgi:hypothetical protein
MYKKTKQRMEAPARRGNPIFNFFIRIGIFFGTAILIVCIIWAALFAIGLIVYTIKNNGVTEGINALKASWIPQLFLFWLFSAIKAFKRTDIHGILLGLIIFFAPIILIGIIRNMFSGGSSPNITLHDEKGNKFTIKKED